MIGMRVKPRPNDLARKANLSGQPQDASEVRLRRLRLRRECRSGRRHERPQPRIKDVRRAGYGGRFCRAGNRSPDSLRSERCSNAVSNRNPPKRSRPRWDGLRRNPRRLGRGGYQVAGCERNFIVIQVGHVFLLGGFPGVSSGGVLWMSEQPAINEATEACDQIAYDV